MARKKTSPESAGEERDSQTMEPLTNGSKNDGALVPSKSGEKKKPEDKEIQDLLVYYAQNSTMHGIPSIVGSELYRGRHFFWCGVVCIMGIFLGTVIYWQMSDYYNYPTVTSVNIAYVGEDDFPAITVCDLNMFHGLFVSMLDDFTAFQLTKLTEITGLYHKYSERIYDKVPEPTRETNDTAAKMGKLIKIISSVISSPKMNPLYCSWGDTFWTLCNVSSARITEMGVCSTIDVRGMAKERARNQSGPNKGMPGLPAVGNAMRGLTFYLDTASNPIPYRLYKFDGFKVVLHDPDDVPLPVSSGFMVQGNTSTEVEISKNVKIGLPPPYKAFGSGKCVDTKSSSFESPLKRYKNYTKEACEHECFVDFVVKTCGGCRHFLHPGNESLCNVEKLAECYRQAEGDYYGGTGKGENTSNCYCPMPCEDAKYSASVSAAVFKPTKFFLDLQDKASHKGNIDQTISYVHFYYADPVVTTIEQVPIYSTEGLLGNIGGQIGLFMGFSLITVAETLELIFLLATRGRRLDEQVKIQKARQESLRMTATATA